jgi:hypothetical protein
MNIAASHLTSAIRRISRAIADGVAECNYATHRMTQLSSAPDRYLADPDAAPATYAEFLFRTSGLLDHEPAARARR